MKLQFHSLLFLSIFCQIYVSVDSKDLRWFNITVQYRSGESTCKACPQHILVDHFACSDNSHKSKWDSGIRRFNDPLNFGYIITRVYVDLLGSFHCIPSSQDAEVRIFLNEFAQSSKTIPAIPSVGCLCPKCNDYYEMPESKEQHHGWPSYNYSGVNEVQVSLLNSQSQSLCLSDINIKLLTRRVFPRLSYAHPNIAPFSSNTTVIVGVDYLDPDIRYKCDFDFADATAQIVDKKHVSCKVPPMEVGDSDVRLRVMPEWADRTQTYHKSLDFSFYPEPKISNVFPSKGSFGDVITLKGFRFFNSSYLACTFNNVFSNATFVSKNEIRCTVPQIHINDIDQNLVISVSQNGQQISESDFKFLYIAGSQDPDPNAPNDAKPTMRWVIVGCLFSVLTIVVVITLFICFKKRSSVAMYEKIEEFESIAINHNDIDVKERIGRGSFGDIYRGYWRSTEVAIKKILTTNLKRSFVEELIKEASIMKNLRHPNILSILGYCTIPPDVCIVMEYMPLGSLYQVLHSEIELPWSLLQKIAIDASKGMNYLHKSNPVVIHRDLKTQNLLVDEYWRVKICDFGLSKLLVESSSPQTMTQCGTPIWSAPEVLKNHRYSEKADVYSFGICLWEMYAREDPYTGMTPYKVIFNIVRHGLRPEIKADCPKDWAALMRECWDEDQEKRPTFEEIIFKLENMSLPLD